MDSQLALFELDGLGNFTIADLKTFVKSDVFPDMSPAAKKNYTSLMNTLDKLYPETASLVNVTHNFKTLLEKPVFGKKGTLALGEKSRGDYLRRLLNCLVYFLERHNQLDLHKRNYDKALDTLEAPKVTLGALYQAVSQADLSVFRKFTNLQGVLTYAEVGTPKLKEAKLRHRRGLRYALAAYPKEMSVADFAARSQELVDWIVRAEGQHEKSAKQRVAQVAAVIRNHALFVEAPAETPASDEVPVMGAPVRHRYIYQERSETRPEGVYVTRHPVATLALQQVTTRSFKVALSRCNTEVDTFSRATGRAISAQRLLGPSVVFEQDSDKALEALFKHCAIVCSEKSIPTIKKEVEELILRDEPRRLALVGSFRAIQS